MSDHMLTLIVLIKRETGARDVTPDTPIEDLGIDSLEFLSLLHVVEDEIGAVPEEQVKSINTVRDLANAVVIAA